MNVLIACEESQTVCKAFQERGHNAFSCEESQTVCKAFRERGKEKSAKYRSKTFKGIAEAMAEQWG